MKKWGKMFAIFACLVLALAMAGCGGKSEKFTANSWVFVHKTDDGNESYINILNFEKNGKTYTTKEKTFTYQIKDKRLYSIADTYISGKYEMNIDESEGRTEPGFTYDEKTDGMKRDGLTFYTYMSKDNTVMDQGLKKIYKKASKEDIEKIKKEMEAYTQKNVDQKNQQAGLK